MADILLFLSFVFALFMLYGTYKMDKDPLWAQIMCIIVMLSGIAMAAILGFNAGCKMEQDLTFLAHWHILAIIFAAFCAFVAYFFIALFTWLFLYTKASENGWHKLRERLDRARWDY